MPENFYNKLAPQEDNETIKEIAKINFDKWKNSLLSKEAATVANLYSEDATFLPTVSNQFKRGREGAEEYFKHFLEKDPTGEIIEEEIQALGDNSYLHSGMYNFEVGPNDNRQIVEARFSFFWTKNNTGEWEIVHHHSSVKPK